MYTIRYLYGNYTIRRNIAYYWFQRWGNEKQNLSSKTKPCTMLFKQISQFFFCTNLLCWKFSVYNKFNNIELCSIFFFKGLVTYFPCSFIFLYTSYYNQNIKTYVLFVWRLIEVIEQEVEHDSVQQNDPSEHFWEVTFDE